jgi:hypothetical protein
MSFDTVKYNEYIYTFYWSYFLFGKSFKYGEVVNFWGNVDTNSETLCVEFCNLVQCHIIVKHLRIKLCKESRRNSFQNVLFIFADKIIFKQNFVSALRQLKLQVNDSERPLIRNVNYIWRKNVFLSEAITSKQYIISVKENKPVIKTLFSRIYLSYHASMQSI